MTDFDAAAAVRPRNATRLMDAFTPVTPTLRQEALVALADVVRRSLDLPESTRVEVSLPDTLRSEPIALDLLPESGGLVRVRFHPGAAGAWRVGDVAISVVRQIDNVRAVASPGSRDVLLRMSRRFESGVDSTVIGAELKQKLDALRLAWTVEDRTYRHIEQAHNGTTGFLRVGFGCNQDCHFCWQARDWPAPPDALIFTWLEELAASGVRNLILEGGEPTLWRQLPELVQRAARVHGMQVQLNTNAIRFSRPDYATTIRDAGVRNLLVSLHAADAALSDRLTRAPGTHARTLAGIHAALDAGIIVVINCVVQAGNVEDLPAHARMVRELFVEAHPDNPVRMVNYSQAGRYWDVDRFVSDIAPLDVVQPYLTQAARTLNEVGTLLEITGTCGFPPCVLRDLPEALPWRPRDTMDPMASAGRSYSSVVCTTCAVRDQCVGLRREYMEVHGDRGVVPFDTAQDSDWYDRLAASPLGKEFGDR